MAHPELINRSPFEAAAVFVTDHDARPIAVLVVKATFDVSPKGLVTLAEEQEPVELAGTHHGEPVKSSPLLEPEIAPFKPGADIVLHGHARALKPGTTESEVLFRVGQAATAARVVGDRFWEEGVQGLTISPPQPFEAIPLLWEHAFGGWDRSHPDENRHDCEPRNPIGRGFRAKHGTSPAGQLLPNLEHPIEKLTSPGMRVTPVGFGFVNAEWQPRASYAGTYDQAWTDDRAPALPKDFDPRFYNAAAPDLVCPAPLHGSESVVVVGATSHARWEFNLPGVQPPAARVALTNRDRKAVELRLDTLVVNADTGRITLLWRGQCPLRSGPHDVRAMEVQGHGQLAGVPLDRARTADTTTG